MVLSLILDAPGRPRARPRAISASACVVGIVAS